MTRPWEADELMAFVQGLGQPVDSAAKVMALTSPPPGQPANYIVLDRVKDGVTPPYCVHGYSECMQCRQPVWLGHATEGVVSRGEAYPICLDCARTDFPKSSQPTTRVHDHLRKDGPHA